MKINFTDVPDAPGFDPVPAGYYIVNVSDGKMGESGPNAKHSGTPYINWDLVITEPSEYAGRHIFNVTSLHQESLQYGIKPLLKATEKYNTDGEIEFDIADVVGSKFGVKVSIQKQEGYDDKNNVRQYLTLDDAYSKMSEQASKSASLLP